MALITCDFFSEALERGTSMTVVLPQPTEEQIGVAEVAVEHGRPPVLYLLHGLSDDHTAWLRYTSIERYAAARGLAVVMPAVDRLASTPTRRTATPTGTTSPRSCPAMVARVLPGLAGPPRERSWPACRWAGTARSSSAFTHPERYAAVASACPASSTSASSAERLERAEIVDRVFDGAFGPEDDLFELLAAADPATRRGSTSACGTEEDRLMPANTRLAEEARAPRPRRHDRLPARRPRVGALGRQIQDVIAWLPLALGSLASAP